MLDILGSSHAVWGTQIFHVNSSLSFLPHLSVLHPCLWPSIFTCVPIPRHEYVAVHRGHRKSESDLGNVEKGKTVNYPEWFLVIATVCDGVMGWGEERDCHRSPDDSLWLPGCVQELVLLGGQAQGVAGMGTGGLECFSFCYVLFPTSSSWASWLFNSCCEWTLLPSGGSWFGRHAAASAWTQMARCLKTQACVDGKNKRYWQIFLSPIIGDKIFCSSLKIE